MHVFSGLRLKPRWDNHRWIWIWAFSRLPLSLAMTIKSSAYLTTPSFGLADFINVSNPCNPILASRGEQTPPCGVPVFVGLYSPSKTNPAFNHPSIRFLFGNWPNCTRIDSWAMLSKKPWISASKTQLSLPLQTLIKVWAIASWQLLPHLIPILNKDA